MKQNHSFRGLGIARLLLLLALVVVGSAKSLAVETTAIELGKEYTQAKMSTGYYSFTVANAGKYRVAYTTSAAYPFSDSNFSSQIETQFSYTISGGQQRVFTLDAAGTYYLMVDNALNGSAHTFMVEELASLDTTDISPVPSTVYSITGTGQLSVKFNMGVTISDAYLTAGTVTKTLTRVNSDGNTSVLFELKSILHDILTAGALKAGDEFSVTLNGIHASDDANTIFGDNGSLTLKYKMPEMPTSLESKSVPSTFLSYWEKGNTAGILTLTFSDELSDSCGTAALSYGNLDNDAEGEYYYETLPITINGKTLTVDFTDKVRTPATMTPQSDSIYSVISVKIGDVRNKAGQLCYTESSGTMGSYTFQMPYQVLATGEVTTEFTPASGEDLTNVDNIELYIAGEANLKYDGVNFNYTLNGAKKDSLIANDKITRSTEDDAVVLSIPVPTEVKTAKDVTVSLANLVSLDGVKRDISAKYNGFVLKLIHPATTSLDTIHGGDSLVVWTNKTSQIGDTWSMRFQIWDLNPTDANDACVQSVAYMHKAYNAETGDTCFVYNWDETYNLVFIKGHTYQMTFEAAATESDLRKKNYIGLDTILISGLSKEYEYSLYNLVSIDPNPDSTLIESVDQRVFNLEFDGLVTINNDLAFISLDNYSSAAFESIKPTDEGATDDTKYSRKWQLTVSESTMKGVEDALPLSIAAEDELGNRVKGNAGKEASSYFSYTYEATIGVPDVTITPADSSTVAQLDTITAEFNGSGLVEAGIDRSYTVSNSKVIVYDKDGNEVAHVKDTENYIPDSEMDNWDYQSRKMYIFLNNKITAAGEYTLVIPKGYMTVGSGYYNYNSKPMKLHYTVVDPSADELVKTLEPESITPDTVSTSKVQQLSTITLTYAEEVVINPNITTAISVVSKSDRSEVTTATAAVSADDANSIVITLAEPISAEGAYTVVVPEGLIGNKAYATSNYTIGRTNAEYGLNYEVGEAATAEGVEADPAPGTVTSLSRIILTFTDASDVAPSYNDEVGSIELRDASGAKVVGATSDTDWNIEEWNKIPVDLDSEVTADGTYTLHIPAGFYLLNEGATESAEINLTYVIGSSATGISKLFAEGTSKFEVYNAAGVKVLSTTDKSQLNTLKSGMYIINGKKVVLLKK